ncbi:hypothetical protein [Hydrogenimonas sp. SS33]|uniref:4Fe-4S binding protein n=1 Tax=Hydrogenimonas leucolamina TaxID=2954236 RepID=UPI00336BFE40
MVTTIERDGNDLFAYRWGELFFKNPKTLFVVRSLALGLFVYALVYGFIHPEADENHFTTAVFWSFFWPFFMFLSLPTLGAYFCSICPLAFVGKKIIHRPGKALPVPKFLKNPYISLGVVLGVYWGLFYAFPAVFAEPVAVALFYTLFTLLAFTYYFLFKEMGYCATICPISAIRNAFSRIAFMWLGSYESACATCHTYECAKACEFGQSPFNFNKNNSMGDCTLCMDCANACAAIGYKAKGFGFSLSRPIRKARSVDVWTYILLFAFMTLTLKLKLDYNPAPLGAYLPWMWVTHGLEKLFPRSPLDFEALLTLLTATAWSLWLVYVGFKKASDALGIVMSRLFVEAGYAYAPLALVSSVGVACVSFFTRYFHNVVNGFIQAFHLPFHTLAPLATPDAPWLRVFGVFDYIAVGWTLLLLWRRIALAAPESPRHARRVAFVWLSLLPLSYMLLCLKDFL